MTTRRDPRQTRGNAAGPGVRGCGGRRQDDRRRGARPRSGRQRPARSLPARSTPPSGSPIASALRARAARRSSCDPKRLQALGLPKEASLTVSMLDTKRTFDDIVARHAPNATVRDRILQNRFYQYVSTSLAGTQSYMAMEKVLAVLDDPSFDLVVLDTPPTSDALDFLEAPERLVEALDSPAMRWLVDAFEPSRTPRPRRARARRRRHLARRGAAHGPRLSRAHGRVRDRAQRSLRRLQGARPRSVARVPR